MGLHKNITGDDIHIVHTWSYADSTARLAATGFTSSDVGKIAEQQSDETWWLLTNYSPITWKDITASSGNDPDAIHDNVAGEIAAITEKTTPIGTDLVVIEDSADSNNKKRVQFSNFPAIQDAESLLVQVRKDSSGTINIGQPVYLVGWDTGGGVPTVELADSSSASTMPAFGVARSTITNLATGEVIVAGELTDQDTSSYSVGDNLYVSETTGQLTSTKPTGTALIQKVGQVTRSHPTAGVIQIFGAGRSNDVPNIPEDQLWLGNASGVATPTDRSGIDDTAIHDNVAAEISAVTEKTAPVAADIAIIEDSADSNNKKKIQLGNIPIAVSQASATADTTITSTSPTAINSMTVTPGAGSYVAMFSASAKTQAGGDTMEYAIYSNGSKVAHSERTKDADDINTLHSQAYITGLGAGEAIDVRGWNTAAGKTTTIYERSLILVKVA